MFDNDIIIEVMFHIYYRILSIVNIDFIEFLQYKFKSYLFYIHIYILYN